MLLGPPLLGRLLLGPTRSAESHVVPSAAEPTVDQVVGSSGETVGCCRGSDGYVLIDNSKELGDISGGMYSDIIRSGCESNNGTGSYLRW